MTAIELPAPRLRGTASVEEALALRRSVRDFTATPLSLPDVAQLLWSAQGVTGREGERTAPSAGALYPLELYVVAGAVDELDPGVCHYLPGRHALEPVGAGDVRSVLAGAAADQDWVAAAPVTFAMGAVESRMARKYGERAGHYVTLEVGHAAENLALQAVALGLGSTMVGAFDEGDVRRLLRAPRITRIQLLVPVGWPR